MTYQQHSGGGTTEAATPIIPALLTLDQITTYLLPLGKRTLHRWISAGEFPKADITIGSKVRLWKRDTVEAWIDEHTETL